MVIWQLIDYTVTNNNFQTNIPGSEWTGPGLGGLMGVLDCARYQYAFCVKGHMKRNTTPLSICKKSLFQQIILALREHHIDEQFYYKPIFFFFF